MGFSPHPSNTDSFRLLGLHVWGSHSLRVQVSITQECLKCGGKYSAVDVMDKKEILENTKARGESVRRDRKRGTVAAVQAFPRQPSCWQQPLCEILMVSVGVL